MASNDNGKPTPKRVRDQVIIIRVTKDESDAIRRRAQQASLPISTYLRLIGTGKTKIL